MQQIASVENIATVIEVYFFKLWDIFEHLFLSSFERIAYFFVFRLLVQCVVETFKLEPAVSLFKCDILKYKLSRFVRLTIYFRK